MFRLIVFTWKNQVAYPVKQTVFSKKNAIKAIKLLKQFLWVFEKMGPCNYFFIGIEMLDDSGRIARRNTTWWNIAYHHGTGTNNAVFSNRDTLADNGTLPHPNIVRNVDRGCFSHADPVIDVVPV